MILTAISLVTYGLSGYINSALGLGAQSIFSEPWKLIALSIGASILLGIAQPNIRGVKRGDKIFAFIQRTMMQGAQQVSFSDFLPATALEDGKVGSRIKVILPNGAEGEGIITAYQGAFSPPTIRLVESERIMQ